MGRDFLSDLREAFVASTLLGVIIAVLYRFFVGEVPWTFFVGEVFGLLLGFGLLVSASPRPRR